MGELFFFALTFFLDIMLESIYTFPMSEKKTTGNEGSRILNEIRKIEPFVEGSLTITKKRCGNPDCRCAKEGPIHQTALLTWKENKKTRTLYVPVELREEVEQWVKETKRLKQLMRRMSQAQRKVLIRKRKSKKT